MKHFFHLLFALSIFSAHQTIAQNAVLTFQAWEVNEQQDKTWSEIIAHEPDQLCEKLLHAAKNHQASLAHMHVIHSTSGYRARMDWIKEWIYACEYEPPELPSTVGRSVPVLPESSNKKTESPLPLGYKLVPLKPSYIEVPTCFEPRNTGESWTCEFQHDKPTNQMQITLQCEDCRLTGEENYSSKLNGQQDIMRRMPIFEVDKIEHKITVPPKTWSPIAVWKRENHKRLIWLLRADLQK